MGKINKLILTVACIMLLGGVASAVEDVGVNCTDGANSISGMVWWDEDCDGCQDEGEPGLEGIKVTMLNCSGWWKATAWTNESGYYVFENLECDEYKIKFDAPEGYNFTTPDNCSDDIDSDAIPGAGSIGVTDCIFVLDGELNDAVDAGLCKSVPDDEFDPLCYDESGNGMIEKSEVMAALSDYFSDKITKDNVFGVILLYFMD